MDEKLHRIYNILREQSISQAIISSPEIISYVTGYFGFSHVEREVFLLITPGKAILLTDTRYSEATTRDIPHFQTHVLSREMTLNDYLLKFAKADFKIGFEADNLTVAEFIKLKKTKLKFVSLSLRNLRIVKSDSEIAKIRKAAEVAYNAFAELRSQIKPGMTEKQCVNIFEVGVRKNGADVSFPTIVAFGKNASVPHHMPGNTILKENDVVLVDFGAKFEGYCSDCTRTFFIGKIPNEWKEIYHVVEIAQQKAIEFLKTKIINHESKISAAEVDKAAREYIESQSYPTIPHSLGHGIGLQVHEAPTLNPHSKDKLSEGMVFSIEPGIYLPGRIGVRIEDLFFIKRNKLIRLT